MNKLFTKLISTAQYFIVYYQRTFDHTYRKLTGMPSLKRSEITPSLYLGGQYYHNGVKILKKIGITGIVNMRLSSIKPYLGLETIHILHLPTPDLQAPSLDNITKGIQFITNEIESGGKVYIHCHAGEGRGPTMAIAYLMSTGMLLEEAVTSVKQIRTFIKPTPPQIQQLQKLEKILLSKRQSQATK